MRTRMDRRIDVKGGPASRTWQTDRLVGMVQSSTAIYVYWELSPHRRRMTETHFRRGWEALPKRLRVYDVSLIDFDGSRWNRHWDVEIEGEEGNWFIRDLPSGCDYCVDYGVAAEDGRFLTILRSNQVRTPPAEATQAGGWQESVELAPMGRRESVPSSDAIRQRAEGQAAWLPLFDGYSLREQPAAVELSK